MFVVELSMELCIKLTCILSTLSFEIQTYFDYDGNVAYPGEMFSEEVQRLSSSRIWQAEHHK